MAQMIFQEPQKDLMTSGTKGLAQDLTYGRVEPRDLDWDWCPLHTVPFTMFEGALETSYGFHCNCRRHRIFIFPAQYSISSCLAGSKVSSSFHRSLVCCGPAPLSSWRSSSSLELGPKLCVSGLAGNLRSQCAEVPWVSGAS